MTTKQPATTRRAWAIAAISVCAVVAVAAIYFAISKTLPNALRSDTAEIEETIDQDTTPERDVPAIGYTVGLTAPDFTLATLDGDPITLSDYRGTVVILDFWASWCTPCKTAMPVLHAKWLPYRDQGVVLIGVSLDRTEAEARTYIASSGFTDMITLWQSYRSAQAVAGDYGITGIPRTFVIDRDGIIRFANHPGYLTSSRIEESL